MTYPQNAMLSDYPISVAVYNTFPSINEMLYITLLYSFCTKEPNIYSDKKSKEDGRAEHCYMETDSTGRYARAGDILGKGAMKTVYKAIDEVVLGIEVAWNQVKLN